MELIVLCDRELLFVDLITHAYSYLIANSCEGVWGYQIAIRDRGCGAIR
jgi:hypothetical protein